MKVEPYSLYWAEVPFEEQDDSKVRPVMIIEEKAFVVSLLSITSNMSSPENYVIRYWREAGLKKPSAIQIHYAVEIERVGKKIGKLHPSDILEIKARL